jgi:hypothetical protein
MIDPATHWFEIKQYDDKKSICTHSMERKEAKCIGRWLECWEDCEEGTKVQSIQKTVMFNLPRG